MIRCPGCGRGHDAATFPFGADPACACGGRVPTPGAPPDGGREVAVAWVLSRRDCHLCEVAEAVLVRHRLPFGVTDVDSDAELAERFGEWVPVVYLEGKRRFAGRIDEVLLQKWLRARRP